MMHSAQCDNSSAQARVFADHALDMVRRDLAVVPLAQDRTPLAQGFNKWTRRPGECAVSRWAERHPDANIGLIPGLSNLFVADVDDASQVDEVERLFGKTPLRVRTSRGVHLYYRKSSEKMRHN